MKLPKYSPRLIALFLFIGVGALLNSQILEKLPTSDGLYVLSASPTPIENGGYGAELLRLDAERSILETIRKIGTPEAGMNFLVADFAGRTIVSGSPNYAPDHLDVVNMDAVRKGNSIALHLAGYNDTLWTSWPASVAAMLQKAAGRDDYPSVTHAIFLDRPGMGHWLGLTLASNQGQLLIAYKLESLSRSAAARPEILERIAVADFLVQGEFGTIDRGASDIIFTTVKSGTVFFNGNGIDLNIPAPPAQDTTAKDIWQMRAHDRSTTVMRRMKEPSASVIGDGSSPLYVFSAESKAWRTYIVPGSTPRIKMIGKWIMGIASSEVEGRESPGRAGRRQEESGPKPDRRPLTDLRFQHSGKYFPGVLFLINTQTGDYFPIRTDQGDSEILLVEGSAVYYRVNNQLLVASLQGKALGPSRVLAEGDAVPEVHWAFFGR